MTDQSRPGGESRSPERGSFLRQFIGRFQHLLGNRADASLRESLEDVLEEHESAEQSLTSQERLMLLNILNFNELRVQDVMVPRADVTAIDETQGLGDVLALFARAAHSRLPVYRETLDDPVGMYHIKDVIRLVVPGEAATANESEIQKLARLRRPVLFVPPSMPAIDLLIKMQTTRNHLALVIDEYGGTDGLVSIEDLVERIVGDLEDSRENGDKPMLLPLAQGGFEADARLGIEEFEKAVGRNIVPKERGEDLDTLGGLVASLAGRVPQRGEIISYPEGLEFEVLDADPRRLKRLRVRLLDRPGEAKAADEQQSEPRP